MSDRALNVGLANPPGPGELNLINFTRQQLLLIAANDGNLTGLLDAAYDFPLSVISKAKRDKHRDKFFDDVREAILRSFKLGMQIIFYAEHIDEQIKAVDALIKDVKTLEPAGSHKPRLQELRESRTALERHRQELNLIDKQRMGASGLDDIERTESRFAFFEERYLAFLKLFKSSSNPSQFSTAARAAPVLAPNPSWNPPQETPRSYNDFRFNLFDDEEEDEEDTPEPEAA